MDFRNKQIEAASIQDGFVCDEFIIKKEQLTAELSKHLCPYCGGTNVHMVNVGDFTVEALPWCDDCKKYTRLFEPLKRGSLGS